MELINYIYEARQPWKRFPKEHWKIAPKDAEILNAVYYNKLSNKERGMLQRIFNNHKDEFLAPIELRQAVNFYKFACKNTPPQRVLETEVVKTFENTNYVAPIKELHSRGLKFFKELYKTNAFNNNKNLFIANPIIGFINELDVILEIKPYELENQMHHFFFDTKVITNIDEGEDVSVVREFHMKKCLEIPRLYCDIGINSKSFNLHTQTNEKDITSVLEFVIWPQERYHIAMMDWILAGCPEEPSNSNWDPWSFDASNENNTVDVNTELLSHGYTQVRSMQTQNNENIQI